MAIMPSESDYDFNNPDAQSDGGPDEPKMTPKPIAKVSHGGGRPTKYRTKNGTAVPGVTTITGRFKESGALVHWAWKLGIDGEDYRKVRDAAANAGTIAHTWIDDEIHGRTQVYGDFPVSQTEQKAREALEAFRSWAKQVRLKIVDTERPLISEEHLYGGTYDAIALLGDTPVLLDWKSGNRVYSDHVIQVAAYRQLCREATNIDELGTAPASACLLRVDKEFASFAYYSFPSAVLDAGWEAFKHMRSLYEIDKTLKRAVGA